MSQPFSAPHERRCDRCQTLFRSDAPGVRFVNAKGNPRYLHCGQPRKGWKPAGDRR